jgi:hypothetical protein
MTDEQWLGCVLLDYDDDDEPVVLFMTGHEKVIYRESLSDLIDEEVTYNSDIDDCEVGDRVRRQLSRLRDTLRAGADKIEAKLRRRAKAKESK